VGAEEVEDEDEDEEEEEELVDWAVARGVRTARTSNHSRADQTSTREGYKMCLMLNMV
jgi:hypothetical protein